MSDLSPQLQQLVIAGRNASRPTEADFQRVLGAIQAHLAAPASGGEHALAPNTGNVSRLFSGKAIAVASASIALAVGGIASYRSHAQLQAPEPSPAPVATAVADVQAQPLSAASAAESVQEQAPATLPAGQDSVKAANPTNGRELNRSRDSLSEEVAILSRAETELHGGRAEAALKTLSEHERKFPRGILTEERIAARIQALCALGRTTEANALLARLRPGSLHGESSREACSAK